MAIRGRTPGLIRRKRAGGVKLYWSAANIVRDLKYYPEPLIPLPSDATAEELVDLCETYVARLDLWLAEGAGPRFVYDGTIKSLCDAYENYPESPIHDVQRNTADSYIDSIRVIRATVGSRAIIAVSPLNDVKCWYREWRAPAKPGGPDRIKRAHAAISMFRTLLRFGQAMGHKPCAELFKQLSTIRFERSSARHSEMTVQHARAIIAQALARQDARGLYMAIGVATQFATMLRQKDVIGEWQTTGEGEVWVGGYTWENIPGGILRIRTSKTKAPGAYDLTKLELLWPLMQQVPQSDRHGAIVKGEHGLPIRERSYRKWFREIANLAGVPADVWNMDSRAGAVTEALEAGVDLETVQRAATHSKAVMTQRYERRVESSIATIAAARTKARKPT